MTDDRLADIAAHEATIRHALGFTPRYVPTPEARQEAHAALDGLLADVKRLTEERDEASAREEVKQLTDDQERLGDRLKAAVLLSEERLRALKRRDEALAQLRDAWNAHMTNCPIEMLDMPTFDEIAAWQNAPSNTASGPADA